MRLFVAVDPPDPVRVAVEEAIRACAPLAPDAKWQRSGSLHLTLAFLGHLPDERMPAIAHALAAVAPRHRPIDLRIEGAGTFGSRARPRVLFLAVGGALAALESLHRDVELALRPLGYVPEERAFRPHLTLARARPPAGDRDLARAREALDSAPRAAFTVGELILYRSDLSPEGARYTPLARWPLGAAAPPP